MDKEQRLANLYEEWKDCKKCRLCKERNNIVFGYGNPYAQLMLIGEAPGKNEDETGLPFVGDAGILLDWYLGSVSVEPEITEIRKSILRAKSSRENIEARKELRNKLWQSIYITNIVACRPPENRDPSKDEIASCYPRLKEIIYVVDPVLILAVGKIAVENLIGHKVSITHARGELFDVEFDGRISTYRYPVLAALHPAYLLRRNDFNQVDGDTRKTYNDFLKAMLILDEFNERHFNAPKPDRQKILGEIDKELEQCRA